MIYAIGDSHCWHAWLKIPGVITRTCGPMTMHSFGLSKAIIVNDIPKSDFICFCWGEIDCRCHVHKYQPWQQTIDTLVKNYLDTIRLNAAVNKNIMIYNVVPPPRRSQASENAGFPFLGSDGERLAYVRYMNSKLKESEFIFIDVYDKYSDKEGFLDMSLSDNHVHIENELYLAEWLDQNRSLLCSSPR